MTNNELYMIIKELKKEGISHKALAEHCGITYKTMSNCIFRRSFSEDIKKAIICYLTENENELYQTIKDKIKSVRTENMSE